MTQTHSTGRPPRPPLHLRLLGQTISPSYVVKTHRCLNDDELNACVALPRTSLLLNLNRSSHLSVRTGQLPGLFPLRKNLLTLKTSSLPLGTSPLLFRTRLFPKINRELRSRRQVPTGKTTRPLPPKAFRRLSPPPAQIYFCLPKALISRSVSNLAIFAKPLSRASNHGLAYSTRKI
jgi:hypothetical protein